MRSVTRSSCSDASTAISRRALLKGTLGCGAYVMLALSGMTAAARRAFGQQVRGEPVITRPFARVEKLAEGLWAVVATPEGGMEVLSNAGIIAGRDATLVIEGQSTPAGARFVADAAKELTGRYPTHVVLTHFHFDHADGLSGHLRPGEDVRLICTGTTRGLLCDRYKQQPEAKPGAKFATADAPQVVPETVMTDEAGPTELDLGGRTVRLVPRIGHTPSDVTIEVTEPRIVWTGDLVFNRMFPYYGDALPSRLRATCQALCGEAGATYVPGHGPVADAAGLRPYLELLDHVEAAARAAHEKGIPASEAWKSYQIPESLGDWHLFRPDITRYAFEAWERELRG